MSLTPPFASHTTACARSAGSGKQALLGNHCQDAKGSANAPTARMPTEAFIRWAQSKMCGRPGRLRGKPTTVESRRQAEKLKGCRLAPTTSFPAFPCENNLSSHSVMRGLRSSNSAADEDVEDDRLPTQSVFQVCRSFKFRLSQFKAVCAPTTDPGEPIQFEDSGMNGFGSKSWLPMPRHIAAPRRRP